MKNYDILKGIVDGSIAQPAPFVDALNFFTAMVVEVCRHQTHFGPLSEKRLRPSKRQVPIASRISLIQNGQRASTYEADKSAGAPHFEELQQVSLCIGLIIYEVLFELLIGDRKLIDFGSVRVRILRPTSKHTPSTPSSIRCQRVQTGSSRVDGSFSAIRTCEFYSALSVVQFLRYGGRCTSGVES